MKLNSISFENFRNIKNCSLTFSDGLNIIFGENAQGKTNVLEGIYLFACGRSFRVPRDREMIAHSEESSRLAIKYSDSVRENEMKVSLFEHGRRECTRNGMNIGKLSSFIGNFRAVIFSPEDLAIVKQEPALRRNFMDYSISQLRPMYVTKQKEYKMAIQLRNDHLKKCQESGEDYGAIGRIISSRMADPASYLTCIRASYLERIFARVSGFMRDMTDGNESITYKYINSISDSVESYEDREKIKSLYFDKLMNSAKREIAAGMTLYGPHRDDFMIKLDNYEAKYSASQGQQRSIALSLILGQGEIVKEETGEYPVFLFDDVFSELDKSRKEYLLGKLSGRQVIVTACDEKDFSEASNTTGDVRIHVKNGEYEYISGK